jgi:hypothetical protein
VSEGDKNEKKKKKGKKNYGFTKNPSGAGVVQIID